MHKVTSTGVYGRMCVALPLESCHTPEAELELGLSDELTWGGPT